MAATTDDKRIELLDAADYSEYVLRDPREINAVLNGLVQQRCIVSAHPDRRRDFVLTTLLGIDTATGRLYFDSAHDDDGNRRLTAAASVTFSALLEKIKVQFSTEALEAGSHDGHTALVAPPPEKVLRLQRREYFRLVTPTSQALVCTIPVRQGSSLEVFEARVMDISGGGIGVLVPPKEMRLSTDAVFDECTLVLPEFGTIVTRLRIRNIFRVTNRNGVTMLRAGCQFVKLSPGAENMIQRYILKTERERNARARRL
ncbi:MAG: flagellar brake protein [Rhodocyclaceae bacterium]|nr:flagellar brake protein [Rhodocyclaceae bacterium]MCB1907768.1 flagellar brake protein [Rhodocyclaceae bacterium]